MIQARSPYYIQTRELTANEFNVKIDLYVWRGDRINFKPAEPNYSFTIIRPSAQRNVITKDISPMIRDFFINESVDLFQNSQTTQDQNVWVQWEVYIEDSLDDDPSPKIAVEGYTEYLDNINFEPDINGKVLISSSGKKIWNKGLLVAPVSITDITQIEVYRDGTLDQSIDVGSLAISRLDSANQIYYVVLSDIENNKNIEVRTSLDGYTFDVICEHKFVPINMIFKNKLGVYENLYLFKKPQNSLEVERQNFKTGDSTGLTYDTSLGQYRKFNTKGKESISATTGFVTQSFNKTLEQLLLSERTFIQNDKLIPVNITSNSEEFKTQLVDQKISYDLEFEYAFDKINTM